MASFFYSQLQLSLELRNCFPYVRSMMPLILANSYQITSILHMVLSTVTVSVFIEKIFERPLPLSPSPFFGGILGCFSQKLWGIGFSPFETFRFGFLYFWHLGLSLVVIFFYLVQFSFLGPAGTGEILGPKFAERDPFIQW